MFMEKKPYPRIGTVLEHLEELRRWSEEIDPRQRASLDEAIERLSNVLYDLSQPGGGLAQTVPGAELNFSQTSLQDAIASWRRRMEWTLQESEDLFRPLAENINLILWMRSPEADQILYVSPAYEKVWGRTRESLYRDPQSFIEALHPEDRERVIAAMAEHKYGGLNEEYRIIAPDGSVRWVLARTFPIRGQSGQIARIAGFAQDITEQKEAEEALRAMLSRMRERYIISRRIGAARTAEDVLHALRSVSAFADASRAAILRFDGPWEDSPPSRCDVLADWRADADLPVMLGESYEFEKYRFADLFSRDEALFISDVQTDSHVPGSAREWLAEIKTRSLLLFPLITSNEWYGILTIHFSRRKMLRAEEIDYFEKVVNQAAAAIYNFHLLEAETRARKEAEQANELKLKFLAMISHELRTPLTSIKGFATTLLADDVTWDPNSQRDFIETINQEADKLTDLIEHLLDLSRLESGTLRIVPEEGPLTMVVDTAIAQLQALTTDHNLVIALPQDLPRFCDDPQRVAQVLANLVNNAAKYSPAGTQILISAAPCDGCVQINVTDHGTGISPEEGERVFEAFHQTQPDGPPRRMQGAGLGLAICRGLVEAQGGRIWVQDRAGPGTTISFTLPAADLPKATVR